MTEKTRNIIVGITALCGLAGVMFLLLLFGYAPEWLEGGYEVRVHLDNASGLTQGSRVRLSGIDVGRVTQVNLRDQLQHGVEVVTLIHDGVRIPAGVHVKADSPLLGGNPSLALEVGHLDRQEMQQLLPTDGHAVIRGQSLTLVSQFTGELQAAIEEPAQRFEQMADRFDLLSQEWTVVGQNLNRLIEHRSIERVDAGLTSGNLTTVLDRTDQRLREIKQLLEALSQWANNTQLREDVASTIANANQVVQKLSDGIEALEGRYVAVADGLSGAIGSIRQILNQATDGAGSVGKLFYDPSLYDNLNDSAQRLETALDEFRLMVQKWKAEGLPVQF